MLTLDFNPVNQYFVVKCPRHPYSVVETIIKEHGLDFSTSASTPETAVLMTQEAYAAVAFWEFATPRAQERLVSLRAEIDESWRTTSEAHIKCPADVEPWPFQKAGVEYALKRRNTLIADQPGLGKTIQAICFANEINAKRVLVLCPANVRLQWARKIQEWSTMAWPFTVYPILNSRRGVHPDAHWTICSYDLARTSGIGSALSELMYDLVVCDEIHYLKTIDAARTRAVFGGGKEREFPALVERTGSIMGLSGTPLPNRPREAYTVARGLCLGKDTRVLTRYGIKRIVDISADDQLWDGTQWVTCNGMVYKGSKETLTAYGLEATAEHEVLAGTAWSTWQGVLGSESIQFRALATGMGSLKSLDMRLGKAEFASRFSAHARQNRIWLRQQISEAAGRCAARLAEISGSRHPTAAGTRRKSFKTPGFVASCSLGYRQSPGGARTQQTMDINGTVHEEFVSGRDGLKIGQPFSNTSMNFQDAEPQDTNSTEKTITGVMNLETLGGFLAQSTPEIKGRSPLLKPECRSLRPVYDIMNAGPNHQFTILTDIGPMVVHNCWDAIDWMSEDAFGSRFNPLERTEVTDKVTGQTRFVTREAQGRHGELQARLRSNFMVRREKHGERGVLEQLHVPSYEIIHAEETGAVRAALKAESMLGINPEDLLGENIKVDGQIAVARHMMGLALAPQVIDWVDMLLEGGLEKILVYGHHRDVLDKYCEAFGKWGCVRIDGSLGPTQKQQRVDDFVDNPFVRVCAGNLIAMGTGTDGLQKVCERVVFGESDWTPGTNAQGVDRLDRAGQEGKVTAEFIVAPGSISEFILANSLRKAQNVHKALDAQVTA